MSATQDIPRQWEFSRAEALGGAAVCITALLAVLTVGATDTALRVAVWAAAIGAPLLLASAWIQQVYIALGKASAGHYDANTVWIASPLVLGECAMAVVIGAVVAHLDVLASNVFGLVVFGCFLWLGGWSHSLTKWRSRKGSAPKKGDV